MDKQTIDKLIRATVHIVMLDFMPKGIGSGCIVNFNGAELLLTVAHVTNKPAATCIDTGQPLVKFQTLLYSVGAMNYLEMYDITKYDEQTALLERGGIEDIDFGIIDFSFALLKHKADYIQKEIKFKELTIKEGKKAIIHTSLTEKPSVDKEYGFFGRIKPCVIKGTPNADTFETQEIFYGGLKFIRQIKHFYEFELPNPIKDNADFKGTSGAPIMDTEGNLVSLITHGCKGANKIYGIALADFKGGVEATIMTERNNNR